MSWKSSRTWTASSRVGTRTRASGCRSALGSSCSTMGIAKPRVLPDPVFDFASVSRPAVASWITITWIGNGTTIPRATRTWTTGSDTPRSRNERTSEDIYGQAYLDGERQTPKAPRLPTAGGNLACDHDPRGTDGRPPPGVERPRSADRGRQHPLHDRGRIRAPDLVDVVRAPARRAVRRAPAYRPHRAEVARERPLHPVEGTRGTCAVLGAEGDRR